MGCAKRTHASTIKTKFSFGYPLGAIPISSNQASETLDHAGGGGQTQPCPTGAVDDQYGHCHAGAAGGPEQPQGWWLLLMPVSHKMR